MLTLNTPAANRIGSAGKLLPHVELKISPEKEILIKHPLFSGYLGNHSNPVDWYPTGDLGHMDEHGFLHIEGRKRNVIITSFGRNISPEWPESLLSSHSAILQAAVFGEGKPYLTAVITPRISEQVPAAIAQINTRLPDYARIVAHVIAEPFTLANGQLTGTGRTRRDTISKAYAVQIEACYPTKKEKIA